MYELTLSELKEQVIAQMDPDLLIEVLGISMEDLVEALSDFIESKYVKVLQEISQ